MKLRFAKNSLRLRLNRKELDTLVTGGRLTEQVPFPGEPFCYVLSVGGTAEGNAADYRDGEVHVRLSASEAGKWAADPEQLGLYFEQRTGGLPLKVAIEKDLVCVDGPPEERDPYAFARGDAKAH